MARNASLAKGSFYPSPPAVIEEILKRVKTCEGATGFDGCAGKGAAIIELSEDRAAVVTAMLDDNAMLADFTRTQITGSSFSFALTNPPFADETGGGRSEVQFLTRTTKLLVDGGLMIFIAPESVVRSTPVCDHFTEWYSDISAFQFAEDVRHYEEVVLMGTRRKHSQTTEWNGWDWLDKQFAKHVTYTLPAGTRPKIFRKTEPTDAEIVRLAAKSPLRFLLDTPADDESREKPRPPLSIGIGHRALMMASGFLDGAIFPPGEPPHVVRGSCTKEQYVSSCVSTEDDDGNQTTKTVISEKPSLVIRVIESDGTLTTLD